MTGSELITRLLALPVGSLDLPIRSLVEVYFEDIAPPRLIFVDSGGEWSDRGERIIAI